MFAWKRSCDRFPNLSNCSKQLLNTLLLREPLRLRLCGINLNYKQISFPRTRNASIPTLPMRPCPVRKWSILENYKYWLSSQALRITLFFFVKGVNTPDGRRGGIQLFTSRKERHIFCRTYRSLLNCIPNIRIRNENPTKAYRNNRTALPCLLMMSPKVVSNTVSNRLMRIKIGNEGSRIINLRRKRRNFKTKS